MRQSLGVLVLFAVLAVVHTWPLASAPATLSRNDSADTVLNEWIVAWVAHQAVHAPAHLFDANIFYPERHTLAYSEYLIGPAIMGAPLRWAGASPVLVYNLLLIAGFMLTGCAACLLLVRWTGSLAAGLVSGVIVAFNAHTLTRMPHLQAIHFEFFPLALLAFDRLLAPAPDRWRPKAAIALACWFALQGLTSYYSLVMTTTALAVGLAVRPADWLGDRAPVVLPRIALAAAVASVAMLPFLLMYLRVGEVRGLDEIARDSATWRDYLNTPARIHASWSSGFFGGASALYPGFVGVALAGLGLASGVGLRDPRVRMALAFGIVGTALSFGPALPGYALLYRWLPPLQGIRNAARFGFLGIVACGVLAGYGVAALGVRWSRARWWPAAVGLLIALVTADTLAAPIDYVTAARVSRLESRLRGTDAVVVHFPLFSPDRVFHNAAYLLESTENWRPMVNGFSGIVPASYEAHARELAHFPDADSIAALRRIGVTHVWVHDRALRDWTDNETADAVRRSPGLQLLAEDGDLKLYRVRRSDEE